MQNSGLNITLNGHQINTGNLGQTVYYNNQPQNVQFTTTHHYVGDEEGGAYYDEDDDDDDELGD